MRSLNEQFGITPDEENQIFHGIMLRRWRRDYDGWMNDVAPIFDKKHKHTQATLQSALQRHLANRPEIAKVLMDHRASRGNPAALRFWAPVGSSGQYVKFNLNYNEPHVSIWVPDSGGLYVAQQPPAMHPKDPRYDMREHALDTTPRPEMFYQDGVGIKGGANSVVFAKTPALYHKDPFNSVVLGLPASGLTPQLVHQFSLEGMPGGNFPVFHGRLIGESKPQKTSIEYPTPINRPPWLDHFHLFHEIEIPISKVVAHHFERPMNQSVELPAYHDDLYRIPNITMADIGYESFKPDWHNSFIYRRGQIIPHSLKEGPRTKNIRPSVPSPLTGDEIPGVAQTRLAGPQRQPPWWRK